MQRKILIILLLMFAGAILEGCSNVESVFQLAPESRLPRWIILPATYSRADVTMKITIYTFGEVKTTVYGPAPKHEKLSEVTGTIRWHPSTEQKFNEQKRYDVFPNYSIISVKGIDEVFEQKGKNDLLYVCDTCEITK